VKAINRSDAIQNADTIRTAHAAKHYTKVSDGSFALSRAQLVTVRDALKFALEETDKVIALAIERKQSPLGLKAYRADIAEVLKAIT
jgi:hypothetical protein